MNYNQIVQYEIGSDPPYLGHILYSIEHINSDWQFFLQRFTDAFYVNGFILIESHFDLFNQNSKDPTRLRGTKEELIELWQFIFETKKDYVIRYKPDIISHFIDTDYGNFKERFLLYQTHLDIKGYEYIEGINTFYLVKSSILPNVRKNLIGEDLF